MPILLPGELKHFEGTTTTCNTKQENREIFFDSTSGTLRYKKANGGIVYFCDTNNYVPYSGATLDVNLGSKKLSTSNLILSKNPGSGIFVDQVTPTYGWRDLLGSIQTRPSAGGGATSVPDYVAYNGSNIYAFRFGTNAPNNHLHEAFIEYHLPHDYVPGTDLYIHTHWSQATVDTGGTAGVPGIAKWMYNVLYAKGHGTAGSSARGAFTGEISCSGLQQGSTTQYGHMISEIQLSATSPTVNQLDSDNIEVDGLILVRVYRDPTDIQDTLNQDTFVHYVDIHYQSTNIGTKQKSPDFYT